MQGIEPMEMDFSKFNTLDDQQKETVPYGCFKILENYEKTLKEIKDINPDAKFCTIGMYNLFT